MPLYKSYYFYLLLSLLGVIALVSLTLGKDLYMGAPPNMTTFALIHLGGYLFFLLMPVELLYNYYLDVYEYQVTLTLVALSTLIPAQIIDYYCGYLIRQHFLKAIIS